MTKGYFFATIVFVLVYVLDVYWLLSKDTDMFIKVCAIAGVAFNSIGLYNVKRSLKEDTTMKNQTE
jgi:uncharacterized membrane protein YiaA